MWVPGDSKESFLQEASRSDDLAFVAVFHGWGSWPQVHISTAVDTDTTTLVPPTHPAIVLLLFVCCLD
jgi:hypothetical protein